MDLATLIGVIASFGLIVLAIMSGDGAMTFLNIPSIIIVFGGTVGVTLVCFPLKTVLSVVAVLRKTLFHKGLENQKIIETLEDLAKRARKEGLLSLQSAQDDIDDAFYKAGLQLVVDGQEADTIEAIMVTEMEYIGARHTTGQDLFKMMGTYAPAFGMIGTVIGLIQMLQSMSDPSTIGPAMAVALVTTFYGAFLSNVVFLPLATKLEQRSTQELEQKALIMEGLLSIHAGDNPRILVQKLSAFVPPSARVAEAA
ncbi:MAG: motility protein A [Proteobacteria bacterium]|nr:motility protein A [Pseudomonadota bacterium]